METAPKRPVGIIFMSILFLWIGCMGSLFFPILLLTGLTGKMWDALVAGIPHSHLALISAAQFAKFPFLLLWFLLYVGYALIGFGLIRLRNWARRAVLGLMILGGAGAVLIFPFVMRPPSLAIATIAWFLVLSGWQAWYLLRPRVRFAFRTPAASGAGTMLATPPEGMSKARKVLTGFAIVASIALCLVPLLFAVESMMRDTEVYKLALADAGHSTCIAAVFGESFAPGWMTTGSVQESQQEGSADLDIPLRGAKGNADLLVSAAKHEGVWTINELTFVKGNLRMQLIPSTPDKPCL